MAQIKSMTGFGAAESENKQWKVRAEIKSLNNKFLDLNMRLPKAFKDREIELRQMLGNLIGRGSVSFILSAERQDGDASGDILSVNLPLAKSFHQKVGQLINELKLNDSNILEHLLAFPDVLKYEENNANEEDWQFVKSCVSEAFSSFDAFRIQEGKVIGNYLLNCIGEIRKYITLIEKEEKPRKENLRGKLTQSLAENKDEAVIDPNRFEQEMIYYLEKYDIGEEKSRLVNHLDFFTESLENDAGGKKLNFIAQEMGREINTIGSKAYHFPMQQAVVLMKEELEKIKEQLLNVL